jgi:hypothetical protein
MGSHGSEDHDVAQADESDDTNISPEGVVHDQRRNCTADKTNDELYGVHIITMRTMMSSVMEATVKYMGRAL